MLKIDREIYQRLYWQTKQNENEEINNKFIYKEMENNIYLKEKEK